MSVLSDLYQVEHSYGDFYKLGYNWGDDTHPETYQSFVTSGKGTIDQSIFMFQRPNDAWSFGTYCTVITTGNSREDFHLTVSKNRLSKNNVAWFNGQLPYEDMYSQTTHRYIRECEYSPIQTMVGGLAPWIECAYNKYCLFPEFGLIDPNTGTTTPWVDYKTMMNSYSTYRVCNIRVSVYNGPPAGLANPLCVQFAGSLPDVTITNVQGGEYSVTIGDNTEGVFYISNAKIFDTPVIQATGNITNVGNATLATFFDITQMDYELVPLSTAGVLAISIADATKIINRLGFYWSKDLDSVTSPKGINCTDPDLVCAVIDPTTHMVTDEVYEGSDIAQYAYRHRDDPYCNYLLDYGNTDEQGNPIGLNNEDYRENFNPEQSTVEPADEIDIYPPVVATTGGTTLWIMTEEGIQNFFTTIWNPDGSKVEDIVKGIFLFGENPMDSIISLRFYPLNLYNLVTHSQHHIMFGRFDTQLSNFYVTSSNVICLNLGQFTFNDVLRDNDFRDYEPYSEYYLYIPFCGVVEVAAFECVNQTLSIKMIIDLCTGACTAVVFTNNVPYRYIDGMIGIEVPVTGRDMASYAQTVMGAALQGFAGGKKVGGNIAGAIKGQTMAEAADLHATAKSMSDSSAATMTEHKALMLESSAGAVPSTALGFSFGVAGAALAGTVAALSTAPQPQMAGSNTPACGLAKPLYPYFIVKRSEAWFPENYNHLYGRPTNVGGVVGDFVGYSVFASVEAENISGATSEEVALIVKLLQSGVYL